METRSLDRPVPPPSAALLRAVERGGPVRTRHPRRAFAVVVALSLVYAAGLFAVAFDEALRPDLASRSVAYLVGLGLSWALAFIVPMMLVLLPSPGQMLPRVAGARVAVVAFALALVALPLLMAHVAHDPSAAAVAHAPRASGIFACVRAGLAVALVPLAAGIVALRGVLLVAPRSVGAALGAAGGALGGLVLHLHCASSDPVHLALGHGSVVVLGALIGAVVAPFAVRS